MTSTDVAGQLHRGGWLPGPDGALPTALASAACARRSEPDCDVGRHLLQRVTDPNGQSHQ